VIPLHYDGVLHWTHDGGEYEEPDEVLCRIPDPEALRELERKAAALDAVYARTTQALSDPPQVDTGALVDIATMCEAAMQADQPAGEDTDA